MYSASDQSTTLLTQEVMPEKTLTVLQEFSRGRLMYREVMNTLSLDSDEMLFRLMAQADLPMPLHIPKQDDQGFRSNVTTDSDSS